SAPTSWQKANAASWPTESHLSSCLRAVPLPAFSVARAPESLQRVDTYVLRKDGSSKHQRGLYRLLPMF
ncbi:hypothetical protein CSHISOI_11342, partial [Colletotrichum shisoi]